MSAPKMLGKANNFNGFPAGQDIRPYRNGRCLRALKMLVLNQSIKNQKQKKKEATPMKKITCLLLTLILLVPCLAVMAEAAEEPSTEIYAEPILFRGIPWGSTWEEAQKAFPEGIEFDVSGYKSFSSAEKYMLYNSVSIYKDEILGSLYKSTALNGLKVAGYPLSEMLLYFLGTSDGNGNLITDETHSALVYAQYEFYFFKSASARNEAYTDLLGKLTALYGDIDVTQATGNGVLWYGADGTMVLLININGSIVIRYGFSGADEMIEQAHQILNYGDVLDTNNTDGL